MYFGVEDKDKDSKASDSEDDTPFEPEEEQIDVEQLLWYKRVMKWTT